MHAPVEPIAPSRTRRLVVAVIGLALMGTCFAATSRDAAVAATPPRGPDLLTPIEQWINPVAPQFETDGGIERLGTTRSLSALDRAWETDRTYTGGNPDAARHLADVEQESNRTGRSPRQIKQARNTQTAQLLTILVEFNENAGDDFSDVQVPATVFGDRTCVAGDVQSGPLHNNIPDPADAAFADNNSFWVDDFSSEHFNKLLYSEEGITEPVRTDLNDGAGIDISGFTMRNHYLEMSKGAYAVAGAATPWVEVAHSEAWYGADRCTMVDGEMVAGPPQRMLGHPDNPLGPGALAIDAVNALMEQNPDFPLADYDIEDQFDRDDDGNFFEPDGFVDHVVLVHAGEDKSGGGGEQGPYAIWAHSSNVIDAEPIGDTGLRLANYIVQPEDSGVGVFSHEYGHDLGLPDWYDTSGLADSDIAFWDLMASGSHSGPIFQSMPTHMGIWDKWVLGWADLLTFEPGDIGRAVQLGQTSNTPRGTEDGIQVMLPDKTVVRATPHSGENMWWSNNDQDWADVRLQRTVSVPTGADLRFWMHNDFIIESDWDFGFVEVSTDGGNTWTEQKVFASDGTEITTPDGYDDPNGRMADFGAKKYGLTGDRSSWHHDYLDLTPYAGTTIDIRFRYATDAAFVERGWFLDDLSVTADGTTVWSDDAEANNGWTNDVDSFTNSTGAGWTIDTGTSSASHYYMAEWRNLDGFDQGLAHAYDSTYSPGPETDGAWQVQKVAYNAPGMLVWYRDASYGDVNHVSTTAFDGPSLGSKGGLLIVDSHFDPMRHTDDALAATGSVLGNFPTRMQSSDAAFTTWGTSGAEDCLAVDNDPSQVFCTAVGNRGAVDHFTDALGWYPGVEVRPDGLFFRDNDASTVIPSRDNAPYSIRVTHPDGSPFPEMYGTDIGTPSLLGTGNPGDAGVELGVQFEIRRVGRGNQYATVIVTPSQG